MATPPLATGYVAEPGPLVSAGTVTEEVFRYLIAERFYGSEGGKRIMCFRKMSLYRDG
ncbi:hypothetical protein [Spirosoma linguale]|uniref:hypothetical protein n=1 Tax=Spirosoma linguale TaxID=108 RepID=UPI0002DB0E57